MSEFFEGYYFKHQKGENVLCLIVGKSSCEEFIQVITKDFSCNIPFIGHNHFSLQGIRLNIETENIKIKGEILYENLTPIKYDIMGPFKFFPMECRHGIVSMSHKLRGKICLNGTEYDFTDGIGYIEKDSGTSFPSSYVWIQANDFDDNISVMASVAKIPFAGFRFQGCICVILYKGKEYRLATYLGVRVLSCNRDEIILRQGKYKLLVKLGENSGHKLNAPSSGKMTREIIETASCKAKFDFFIKDKLFFSKMSTHASFEYEA